MDTFDAEFLREIEFAGYRRDTMFALCDVKYARKLAQDILQKIDPKDHITVLSTHSGYALTECYLARYFKARGFETHMILIDPIYDSREDVAFGDQISCYGFVQVYRFGDFATASRWLGRTPSITFSICVNPCISFIHNGDAAYMKRVRDNIEFCKLLKEKYAQVPYISVRVHGGPTPPIVLFGVLERYATKVINDLTTMSARRMV